MAETNVMPPVEWQLRSLDSWVVVGRGAGLSLSLEVTSGDAYAAVAEQERQRLSKRCREEAKKLAEYWQAKKAHKDVQTCRGRQAELQARLAELEGLAVDVSNGELPKRAAEEGAVRQQLELLARRLPGLEKAAAAAVRAYGLAGGQSRIGLRSEAVARAQLRVQELIAALSRSAQGALGELLAAAEVVKALQHGGITDASDAERLALEEFPAPPAAPVRLLDKDPTVPAGAYVPSR